MLKKPLVLFILLISLYSCKNIVDPNQPFFEDKDMLQSGFINKYYLTTYPNDNKSTRTDIQYSSVKKINDSVFTKEVYNPAFKLETISQFIFQNSVAKQINKKHYYHRDTISFLYPKNTTAYNLTFGRDTVNYTAKIPINDSLHYKVHQATFASKDTVIDTKSAKIIQQVKTITLFDKETPRNTFNSKIQSIYVKDIGLWKLTLKDDKETKELILVEQIQPKQFEKLAKHSIKRVGYIDFENTIDSDYKLELCGSHDHIFDYYNGQENRSGYIGGKSGLKTFIDSKLDPTKLNNESGYLTFRFVINCKGEAGKFVTNQADFEYTKKQFPKETVMHLYTILSSIEKWQPCIVRDVKRDSYFYVTFILKNGKIQDILP